MRGLESSKLEAFTAVRGIMTKAPSPLIGLLVALLLACSGDPSAVADQNPSADAATPCELLTEAMVRAHLEIPDGTIIDQDDDSDSRFPNCGYRWRVMSEEDEQARREENSAAMMENVKAGRSPNEGIEHTLRTHATIRLTAVRFDDSEAAQAALETVHQRMTQGFKFDAAGKERTYDPKNAWNPVEGVGDSAYYHGSQLSFVSGRTLAHLDAFPVETAVALANAILH